MRNTKISQNQNYGRPSAKKLRQRLSGWQLWNRSMTMLRQIHGEIASTLNAKAAAEATLENAGKWNA